MTANTLQILTEFLPLLGAFLLFLLTHSIPARPRLRAALVSRLGLRGYLLAYGTVSLLVFTMLVGAVLQAPLVPLWPRFIWMLFIPVVVMPLVCLLLVCAVTQPNPYSLGRGGRGYQPETPGIVGWTRHPLLLATMLWGVAHLPAHGDIRGLLLFGGMALFALAGMRMYNRRSQSRPEFPRWQPRPLLTVLPGLGWTRWALAGLLYGALLHVHGPVIGRSLDPGGWLQAVLP